MSLSISTACRNRKTGWGGAGLILGALLLACASVAQEVSLRPPSDAVAGQPNSIETMGSGTATFYLVGPATALKREVQLGQGIPVTAKEVQDAGRYVATVCAGACSSAGFFVSPARAASLSFLVHPSRAPVGENDVISAVAFPFDEFGNLILAPFDVQFQLTSAAKGSVPSSHRVPTHDGVAWFRTNSGRSAGALEVSAWLNAVTARGVVEQVASDPCSLRIKGQRTSKGVMVETEPVRDCSGNPVPDGTVVTFTAKNGNETSTVDAPIKQDVARARISAKGPVVISAASGVVMGNEVRVGGQE
jgi:hypothetical protein